MKTYVVSKIMITPANASIDGKKHKRKVYLYPIPKTLREFGVTVCWDYRNGKKGAIKFDNKKQAQAIAKENDAIIEEIS